MAKSFSDFKDLKSLKKSLEVKETPAAPSPRIEKRRDRVVVNKSKAEILAKTEGITKGMKVRLMDTNDRGVITGFCGDMYEVDIDGLTIKMLRSEFVVDIPEESSKLYRSVPSKPIKKNTKQQKDEVSSELIIDLHIEKIPGNEGIPEWAALDYQLSYFRQILHKNLKHRGRKIIFIHGNGDGTLRNAIRRELDEAFAMSCTYEISSVANYGNSATVVTVR